jgi:hypothetical protein
LTVIGDTTGAGNCFIDNGLYDLYNAGTGEIFARNNFWNQPDSIGIAARVYDFSDNANRGAVLFTPFLVDCPYDLAPVNDLQIVVIDETVHLSWSAIPDADYYRIYSTSDLNDTFILLDESATSNYSFGLPVPSGIHFYQVTAVQNSQ